MGPVVVVAVGSGPYCYPMRRGKVMKKNGGKQLLSASAQFISVFMVEIVG